MIVRLGLQLTLRSGREAFVRLMLTVVAVSVGATILLAIIAEFHAFQTANNKPFWESTAASQVKPEANASLLWRYSSDIFKAQTIKRVDVAALGSEAPILPGISKLPQAGEYYASPELTRLLQNSPSSQLADRFPGRQIGIIGAEALTSPKQLVAFVGRDPEVLKTLPGTIQVSEIANGPQSSVWTKYFRYAFVVGAFAFLFPILILISTATRLAAARREERYAALRLVGATPRQVSIIASIDAIVGAFLGTLLGIVVFSLLRPWLAQATVTGATYFPNDITPTAVGYSMILVAIPLVSTVASYLSLRKVRISPLGVVRKASSPSPKITGTLPVVVGLVIFIIGLMATTTESISILVFVGLLCVLIGLVTGGPWITWQAARLFSRAAIGASSLLAARRLAQSPIPAFRSISGLILAVFLGTAVAAALPVINSTTATPSATAMSDVLYAGFTKGASCGNEVNCGGGKAQTVSVDEAAQAAQGLSASESKRILHELRTLSSGTVIPIYANPSLGVAPSEQGPPPIPYDSIVRCEDLEKLSALGTCAVGLSSVQADTTRYQQDNPRNSTQPIVDRSNPASAYAADSLELRSVLVKVNDEAALETVRTYLSTQTPIAGFGTAPKTFGEAVEARLGLSKTIQNIFNGAVALTLFVAACSLAVTVGGSMVERKRPFGLLRLSGVPVTTLCKVVLLEALLPLLTAMAVAASTAYAMSILLFHKMSPIGTPIPSLGMGYFLIMGAGVVVSILIILLTLPILERITRPDDIRFE